MHCKKLFVTLTYFLSFEMHHNSRNHCLSLTLNSIMHNVITEGLCRLPDLQGIKGKKGCTEVLYEPNNLASIESSEENRLALIIVLMS